MNSTNTPFSPIYVHSLGETGSYLLGIVLNPHSSASELSLIVLAFAVFWFVTFYIIKSLIRPFVHNKPWLRAAVERDYERSAKKVFQDLQINMTKEEAIAWSMNDWPRMQCVYLQHLAGSLFCFPSLLGIGDPSIQCGLAMCGILSEIGWEMQDLAEMIFVRTFFKDGKHIWPNSILIVMLMHHSLSSVLGVPMVLYYRTSKTLHWLTFDLQVAGAIALMVGEYTKLLDISKPSGLRQFKWLNGLALVIMVWTRVIDWSYLCTNLFITWNNDQAYGFLCVGGAMSVFFSLFSYFACVKPYYKKFLKFLYVSAEYESLPADVKPEVRRASVIKLDEAVAELVADDEMERLAEIVESTFVQRRPSRRQSVPVQSRKRQSLVMHRMHSYQHSSLVDKKDL